MFVTGVCRNRDWLQPAAPGEGEAARRESRIKHFPMTRIRAGIQVCHKAPAAFQRVLAILGSHGVDECFKSLCGFLRLGELTFAPCHEMTAGGAVEMGGGCHVRWECPPLEGASLWCDVEPERADGSNMASAEQQSSAYFNYFLVFSAMRPHTRASGAARPSAARSLLRDTGCVCLL